ncbi:MAG: DUF1579 domain-containing protein [FCB group bacterium]|nr:DUF1579 domain-containing protein [FCB group bacterium]
MKRILIILSVFCLVGVSALAGADSAKVQIDEPMPEFGPPEQIRKLAVMAGTWDYKGKLKWDPSVDVWTEHEAVAEISVVAGGGAIQMIYTGEMSGMEMNGLSTLAYDRAAGEWQEVWVDNFSGRLSFFTGKTINGARVLVGEELMNGKSIHSRATTYDITENSYKYKMENSYDGENWYLSMEGTYTRR